MVLVFIRHGQSVWNKENRFTGWTDVLLNDTGIQEALDAGILLRNYQFKHAYVSALKRASSTFELINKVATNECTDITITEDLKERDYGDLTGKNKQGIRDEYGEEKLHVWRRSYTTAPPNGESLADVHKRCGDFYDRYMKNNVESGNDVLVVAHGNSLRALFVHLGFHTPASIESFEIPTGIPIILDIKSKEYRYINRYELLGYQVIDSRGQPTIEVKCYDKCTNKCVGQGSTPSGASCGSNEMTELRDNNKFLYKGKSVFKAVENVNNANKSLVLTKDTCKSLLNIDKQLQALDTSDLKSEIGGNAITAMSFCMADVASRLSNKELYEYLADIYNTNVSANTLPTPLVNIINGGKHGVTDELKIQEFMIFSRDSATASEKNRMMCETYHTLKQLLVEKYGPMAKSIGDEGGFCPPIYTSEEALSVIEESITKAGYVVNEDIFIALDCAASEFYNKETGLYEVEKGKMLSGEQLVDYYGELIQKHPALKSIEDGFDEADYESWILFNNKYGNDIMIVGDDLFTTNKKLISQGLRDKWANTLLLKVNQIGTITEAIEGATLLFNETCNVIVSHRSGETNHAMLIDIAVGIGAKYVKIGSPCRGERVAKFNRLLEIEKHLEYCK